MTKDSTKEQYLSTAETARLLGVSVGTVQSMVERGDLEAWKTAGDHRRINRLSVERILNNQNATAEPSEHPSTPLRQAKKHSGRSLARILVVEDSTTLLEVYKSIFAEMSHAIEVQYVDDGIKALLELGNTHYDLLILDLEIPFVNGYEMLRSIKGNNALRDLHVVIVTASAAADVQAQMNFDKDVEILTKPFNKEYLQGYVAGVARSLSYHTS